MSKFPKINSTQFALSFADYNTGHVLDISLNLMISSEQKEYLVFNSIKDAEAHALSLFAKAKKNFEYYIYNQDEKLVKSNRLVIIQ